MRQKDQEGGALNVDVQVPRQPSAEVGVQAVLDPMRKLGWPAEDEMVKRFALEACKQPLAGSPYVIVYLLLDTALKTRL